MEERKEFIENRMPDPENKRTFANDRVFNNNWNKVDFEIESTMSFNPSNQYFDLRDAEDKLHSQWLSDDLHNVISNSRFKIYNEHEDGRLKYRLDRDAMNCIFSYVCRELNKKYSTVEIFSELCEYFTISPKTWYTNLSIAFQDDILYCLNAKTKFLDKRLIPLF